MKQQQLPFDDFDLHQVGEELTRAKFSHGGIYDDDARVNLESIYTHILEETEKFTRKTVSFQGNKGQILHSWIKYREGFSADLVESLIEEFELKPGDRLLEPFSGSGTTLLVAKSMGISATGIEILPVCHLAWEAKSRVFDYESSELADILQTLQEIEIKDTQEKFPHLVITDTAFSEETERDLMFFTHWVESAEISKNAQKIIKLILTSILEEISFTRKDGQYLRWDRRAKKIQDRNKNRLEKGQEPIKGMYKGDLPSVRDSVVAALETIIEDIEAIQSRPIADSHQNLMRGSSLEILPTLEAEQFAGVITSPPYCNRYDYTRTYALELAYLGCGEDGIRDLRQSQLSCTVEHRSKLEILRKNYQAIGRIDHYDRILHIIQNNKALNEINSALKERWERGEINNKGILPMVEGYFTELAFIFSEIFRTCKSGAKVAFVNDNVRYGGEVIPVDLLTTNLAEQIGFEPFKVYVLPQRKGNSSQQMGKFGREALRKSITIWKKP